jgi:hypothetical protein
MKKIILAPAAILFITMNIMAQNAEDPLNSDIKSLSKNEKEIKKEKREERMVLREIRYNEPTYMDEQSFSKDFGQVPEVSWQRVGNMDEAIFMKDGKEIKAFYDEDADLVGTTTLKTFEDIPANAQKQIQKEYKDYSIEQVMLFDDNENNGSDMMLYDTWFNDPDNYFVELKKDNKKVILEVDMKGNVEFFVKLPAETN